MEGAGKEVPINPAQRGLRCDSRALDTKIWAWSKGKNLTKRQIQTFAKQVFQEAGHKSFKASDGWYRRWMSSWKKADGDFCDDNCQENVMDVEITDDEKLIALVSERRSLWDMSDTNYHMADIQQKLWNEIAEEMNSDVENMQDKWRGLQETFRQEFEKSKQLVYTKGTASPGVIHSTWPYFKYMLFLADFFQHEIPSNSLPSPEKCSSDKGSGTDYESHHSQNNIITPESVLEVTIHEPSTSSDILGGAVLAANGRTKSERSIDDEFLEIEKAKLKLFTDNGRLKEDSEYQFLISLLPYLKRVPQHRKLLVRNRLQQVFIEEEEERQRQAATNRSCQANLAPASSPQLTVNRSDQEAVSTPVESPTSSNNSDSQGHHRRDNERYIIPNIKTEN